MAMHDEVKIQIEGHGAFQTDAFHFDRLMAKYLPASIKDLKAILNARSGGEADYSDLGSVTECLMVLSAFDGWATN